MVNQFMRGIPVNDDTLALDLIDRIGPEGHFLYEDHTFDNFRNVWYSDLFDRTVNQEWLAQGARQFGERLRDKTARVMQHEPAPLPEDILKELAQMATHWE
jgi:trimethylamine--corrinoid protein Co-methyltransferase